METALRILWDCPADLIEKAQAACQTAPDVPALRKALEGYELLGAWLSQMEQWQKPVQREKPWKLVDRWQQQYGASAELDRLKNMAVFHDSFDALWNALALGEEQDLSLIHILSAVATGGQVMQTITGLAVGLTTGGTVLIGRHYGARQGRQTADAVKTALVLFGLLSLAMMAGTLDVYKRQGRHP